mgnify:CR=1 FL=1
MILINKTNVVLPDWLLEQQKTLTEEQFLNNVRGYLLRYADHELVRVEDGLAVCHFERKETDKRPERRKKM